MKSWTILGSVGVVLLAGCQSAGTGVETDDLSEEVNTEENEFVEQGTDEELDEQDGNEEEETENQDEENQDEEQSQPDYTYEIHDVLWTVDPIDDADANIVLATFDDVPDKHSLNIAATLMEHNVPAIFFVNGHFLETDEEKETLQKSYDMGFEIGNHTMTHPDLKTLSEEEQYEEIVEVNNRVEEIIGERPRFFRAPFGSNTDYSRQVVDEEEMSLMNWTYGYDWETEYQNAEQLANIMVTSEYLQDGANLLMHDREWTSEALADIITGIREEGYEFVDPAKIK